MNHPPTDSDALAPRQAEFGVGFASALDHAVLEALVSNAQDAVILIDQHRRVLDWNRAAERIFGHTFAQAVGRDIHELLAPPELRVDIDAGMERFSKTESGPVINRTLEMDAVHRDGSRLSIELSLSSVEVAGRWFGLGVIRDASERKQLEQTLARIERRFSSVVEMNRDGILVLDGSGTIRFANEAAQTLLGQDHDELIGMPLGTPTGQFRSEMAVRRKDGSRGTAEMSSTETEWEGLPGFLVILHDVSELKAAEENARFLSLHDALTGLPNRRLFQERLDRALERARDGHERVAVLFMDLNRLKAINDGLGHDAGDEVLRIFGQRLMSCLRTSDTVARLGGDEFSAVIEGIKRIADLDAVAAKLEACLSPPMPISETELTVGASIGVALYPDDGVDADTLLRHADSAMYAAKRGGSSHFRLFASSMEQAGGAALQLEQQLLGALARGELRLVYQPLGGVADGMLCGMEALLRWHSPLFGVVGPDRFIPLLEASGQIDAVGLWVVEQVCGQIAAWRNDGIDLVPVAVNVSAVQLVDGGFPDRVKETLAHFSISPRLLTVELTETAVIDDENVGTLALERLAALGVWLYMDDFGTGWSSLGMLRKLPFDTIKIDRSFITDIADNEADALLVAGIISMVHSLKKTVVAEGVETEAQLSLLKDYCCDYAQGYLLGRPMEPSRIEQLLRERQALT